MRAKQKWVRGDIKAAREILGQAFENSPDSEQIHLAAVKLEWESGHVQRARMLLHPDAVPMVVSCAISPTAFF